METSQLLLVAGGGLVIMVAFLILIYLYLVWKWQKKSTESVENQQERERLISPGAFEREEEVRHQERLRQLEDQRNAQFAEMRRRRQEEADIRDRQDEERRQKLQKEQDEAHRKHLANLATQNAESLAALRKKEIETKATEEAMKRESAARLAKQDEQFETMRLAAEVQEGQKQREFEERIKRIDAEDEKKRLEHDVEMKRRIEDNERLQREHDLKMRDLIRQAEENRQNRKRVAEERRRQAAEQTAQLMRMLAQHLWNEQVENGWANRLNYLRSSGSAVRRAFDDLYNLIVYEREKKKLSDAKESMEHVKALAMNIQSATEDYRSTLNAEASQMHNLYEQHHAPFLQDIEASATKLAASCEDVQQHLKPFFKNDFNVDDATVEEAQASMENLRRASVAIPTISELKMRHGDWHRQQKQQHEASRDEDEPPAQGVVIMEIDDDE